MPLDVNYVTHSPPLWVAPPTTVFGKDAVKIDMEIKLPQLELALPELLVPEVKFPPKKVVIKERKTTCQLCAVFNEPVYPEPVYFQSFDCIGIPYFFSRDQCRQVIAEAERHGFATQRRHRLVNVQYADIVDPLLARALWHNCGLQWLLENVSVDGMVPCGLNDVIRIQKFGPGGILGRHIDQCVRRSCGRTSQYSLRVFLNCREEQDFDGGLSAFHVPFRAEPVFVEPEIGLALLYPQGDRCIMQEECEVVAGCKYVLRADILFCSPGLAPEDSPL